jgi:hypothetical protein
MKMILAMLISLMFVACNNVDTENLKKENSELKTQLETVTKERDALKVQLEGIKAVLQNAPGTTSITTPDSSGSATTPDSSTTTPDPNATTSTPDSNDGSNTSSDSTPSNTPSSDGSAASTPDSSPSPAAANSGSSDMGVKATTAVESYAKDVLETAQKYNTETQQTPPTDCSSGYTAGTHAVPSSDAIQSCRVDKVDKGFRVTLKDANGAVITLPTP